MRMDCSLAEFCSDRLLFWENAMHTHASDTTSLPCPFPFWLALMLCLCAGTAAAEPVTIDTTTGTVEYRRDGDSVWQPVTAGSNLEMPVELRTGPDSNVRVSQSGTFFDVSAGTRVRLSNDDNTADGLVSRVKQWIGTVFYDVERKPDTFKVETPFLVSTVKGTQFTIVSTDEASFVTLKEGQLEVVDLESGDSQILNPGEIANVSGTQGQINTLVQIPDALPELAQVQALQIASLEPATDLDDRNDMVTTMPGDESMPGMSPIASADLGTAIGADVTTDLGTDLGLAVGADITADVGVEIGVDLIGDISTDISANKEAGVGLDDDLDVDLDIDLGGDLDGDLDSGLDLLINLDGLDDDLGQTLG